MLDEVLNTNLQTITEVPAVKVSMAADTSDDELVRSVLAGDEAAFAEIFEKYKRQVTRTAARFFRERADIEECVQKSFTKAYFSLNRFRGGDERAFPAWLTRITVNICYDEFRRRQKAGEALVTDLSSEETDYLELVHDGRASTAEDAVIAAQLAEKILGSLDAKDRIALTLVYSEDHSLADVAEVMDISVNNLKSRLFRCRNNIKNRFGHLFK